LDWLNKLKSDTLLALVFFTILPIPGSVEGGADRSKLNEAVTAFPVAGLLLAIPSAFVWYFASQMVSPLLAAAIAITFAAIITSGLHEDGLADCFDGLGGAWDRVRALEIMRDSAIGTYGAAALFFSFALRILALASLGPWSGAMALLIAHAVARGSMVIALYTAQYARASGLADTVRDGVNANQFKITIALCLGLSLLLAIAAGGNYNVLMVALLAPAAGFAAAWAMLQWLKSRLGGYTGDGLGAMEQVAEIAIFIALAVFWS